MKDAYSSKKRNANNRDRKSIVMLSVEGKNQTEKNYFNGLKLRNVRIVFARGNDTDPINMAKALCRDYKSKSLTLELGDRAYCVIDGDLSKEKELQIAKAEELIKGIKGQVIVSNPCVEVWFTCHFTDSTKQYKSSDEAVKRLQEFIPDYEKNVKGISDLLADRTSHALENAEKLNSYNQMAGRKKHHADYQPSTEIPVIIEYLNGAEKRREE